MTSRKNVLGEELQACCTSPMTGFYRDGTCRSGGDDMGKHIICAQMTEEFLKYTKNQGNDLSTPNEMFDFPGLKPGDYWCLCALRWKEAFEDGMAPPVKLESSDIYALEYINLEDLKKHSI